MLNSSYGFKLVNTLMRIPVRWVTFPREVSQSWVEGTHFFKCLLLFMFFKGLLLFMFREAGACRCWWVPWSWTRKQCEPSDVGTGNGTVVLNSLCPVFSSLCSYANEQYFSTAIFCLREEAAHIPSLIFPAICNPYIRRARPLGNSKDPGGPWKVYFR